MYSARASYPCFASPAQRPSVNHGKLRSAPLRLVGEMVLHEGAGHLRLEQSAPPQAPSPAPTPAPDFDIKKPPTGADVERNVQSGATQRHSSTKRQQPSTLSVSTTSSAAWALPLAFKVNGMRKPSSAYSSYWESPSAHGPRHRPPSQTRKRP